MISDYIIVCSKFSMIVAFLLLFSIIMSPPLKGWGTYCFWCGSRRRSFLSARYLLNHWMDLDQTGIETSLGQPNGVIRFL